jgi:large subunit ribosomal protein L17
MRHRKSGLKLGRTASHRNALFRNMVTSLFKHDRIRTTVTKAKELRRWADHLVTLAKRGDLHARRQALSILKEKKVVHNLFESAAERFGAFSGGYTRIVKMGRRPGDAAPMSLIELVAPVEKVKKKKTKKRAEKTEVKKAELPEKKADTEKLQEPEKEVKKAKKVKSVAAKEEGKAEKKPKSAPKKKTAKGQKEKTAEVKAKEAPAKKKKPGKKETPAGAKSKSARTKPASSSKKKS